MIAIARSTEHMENDPDDIWIEKGKAYDLKPAKYVFTDEQNEEHYVDVEDFDIYFKEVEQ